MGSSSLPGFWMSIINDSSLQEQLVSVMCVQDVEERALAMLSRTLFLLIMEIKFERDEAVKTSGAIMDVIDGCDSCRKNVTADELTNKTITNSITFNTEPQPAKDGNGTNTISGEICEAPQHSGGDRESQKTSRRDTGHVGEAAGRMNEVKTRSSTSKVGESSVSPRRDVDKKVASVVAGTQIDNDILVPGTMDITESQPQGSPLETTFITQKVFVPETVCMDDYTLHDASDIFVDCDEGSATLVLGGTERQTPTKFYSPDKSPGRKEQGGEGRQKHSSTPQRETRQDSTRRQQQDTTRSPKQQRNSSDTTQQREEDRTATLQQIEYTEDVLVESDSAFRSPSEGSVRSFRSPTRVTPRNRTPSKMGQSVSRSPEGSPVFVGKANRHKRHQPSKVDVKRNISEVLSVVEVKVEVTTPQTKTPDKRGTPERQKLSPRSGRLKGSAASLSPVPSPHNISDDITSPSLLQPLRPLSNIKMEPPLQPSLASQKKTPTGGGGGRGRGLPRPTSSVSTSRSSRRLSLRRHRTTEERQVDRTGGTGIAKLHMSPPDPSRKKTGYKQTTVDNFLSLQTTSGTKTSGNTVKRVFLDDDEALRLAMEESLQLKALTDMGKELDQREEEEGCVTLQEGHETLSHPQGNRNTSRDPSTGFTHPRTPNKPHHPIKESPIKLPNLRQAQTNLRSSKSSPNQAHKSLRSPKSSHRSPNQAHNSHRSPKLSHTSPGQAHNNHRSPRSSHRSPRSEHASPSKAKNSVKRKLIEEEEGTRKEPQGKIMEEEDRRRAELGINAKEEEEEPRKGGKVKENKDGSKTGSKRTRNGEEEDEVEILQEKVSPRKEMKENASPGRGGEGQERPPQKKKRRDVFHDSFDILPQKEEPKFAHQGEVVRKKAARMQLEGWSCKQCKEFYEKAGSSTQEVKELMNKCSRHRSKYKPLSNTPEGFWNPLFDD